jgi:tetratricopeptide (TPR) repeat protein
MRGHFFLRGIILPVAVSFAAASFQSLWAQDAELIQKEDTVEKKLRTGGAWTSAEKGATFLPLDRVRTGELSRAVVRLSDKSELRLDELTEAEIEPGKAVEVKQGGGYFFSREKAEQLQIRTPAVNGALRGTQIIVRVARGGRTTMTLLEGELALSNKAGSLTLRSGEQAEIVPGGAPRKTAVIEAKDVPNLVQWALYYPAVIPPNEFGLSAAQQRALGASFESYKQGDLLGALRTLPRNAPPLYRAAVLLSVGRVDKARAALRGTSGAGKRALEKVIATVKRESVLPIGANASAAEWLAESYWLQSKSDLEGALKAAKWAGQDLQIEALKELNEGRPDFIFPMAPWRKNEIPAGAPQALPATGRRSYDSGFALARIAELQFSFGRTAEAKAAVEQALEITPRNAQAHALRGFLLSAENKIADARASFEQAIAIDPALGNAWLGRGLTSLRKGDREAGRRDLHTAAVLEPTRSIFHSYLGKAFSNEAASWRNLFSGTGELESLANKDLARAAELDPDDPTPPLYRAIQRKQENRYNESVSELEHSLALNDNRRVYRSKFLLDQDKGVRSSNLASIYQNNGMTEVAVREAVRAVNADYGSAAAHLFLANSYDNLRDPRRVLLRYETPWFNEQLLANLLSPVGGGPLSQFVSAQEYSKMFESDGLGLNFVSEYRSDGQLRTIASQYGTFGNLSYALDADYQYDSGTRKNDDLSRFEGYATFKLQLAPSDSILLQTKYQDLRTGDTRQAFDHDALRDVPTSTSRFRELQDPAFLLAGWHHEWSPGNHTLLLGSWLRNSQTFSADETTQLQLGRNIAGLIPAGADPGPFPTDADLATRGLAARGNVPGTLAPLVGRGRIANQDYFGTPIPAASSDRFDFRRTSEFEIFSADLQQIVTLDKHTLILGARFQTGEFDTTQRLSLSDPATATSGLFNIPAADQHSVVDFQRLTLYAYENWRVAKWLTLHAGVTYDDMEYPENFRNPPISDRQKSLDRVSPKVGFTLSPSPLFTMRGVYTEFVSGVSFDESIRLEPTQMAGFAQAFRSTISEDVLGSIEGARYKVTGLSIESKLPTRTYLGADWTHTEQALERSIGVFDILNDPNNPAFLGILPSQTSEHISYKEDALALSIHQLIGDQWSIGARYRYVRSEFDSHLPQVSAALFPGGVRALESTLHEATIFANWNHHTGLFARAEATYYDQQNSGYAPGALSADGADSDKFWMLNAFAGYRFMQNRAELSVGVLNIADTDYQLNSLNPVLDLPRERTLAVRCRFSF